MKLFRRSKKSAFARPRTVVRKKRSLASEFTKKRTGSLRFKVSNARWRISKIVAKVAAFSLFIIIVPSVIIVMFFSEYFAIRHIDLVRRDFRVDSEAVSNSMQEFRDLNIVFLSKDKIKQKLLKAHPQIEKISIDKEFPDTLHLKVSTYPIVAQWKVIVQEEKLLEGVQSIPKEQILSINKVGRKSQEAGETEELFLIVEKGVRSQFFEDGQLVIEQNRLEKILNSRKLLENTLNMPIVQAEYFRNANEIHYLTENDIAIWIDFASSHESQIIKLDHVLAETEIFKKDLDHVDLRVVGRVYWQGKKND